MLASTGVLEISHGRGVFIKSLTVRSRRQGIDNFTEVTGTNLLNWLEFRRTIEVDADALAAQRRTNSEILQLERLIDAIETKLNAGEIAEKLDYEFHVAIALATHNPIYANALRTNAHALQHHIFEDVRQSLTVPARKLLIMKEHRKIVESIRKEDAAKARHAMQTHLLNAERKLHLINDETRGNTH